MLPAATLQASGWGRSAETQFDTVGWPRLVDDAGTVCRSMRAADRSGAVVFAGNYGEAGAVDLIDLRRACRTPGAG